MAKKPPNNLVGWLKAPRYVSLFVMTPPVRGKKNTSKYIELQPIMLQLLHFQSIIQKPNTFAKLTY